jgi:uncharacterized membrane protein YgcG
LRKKSETIVTTSENFNLLEPYIKGFAAEGTRAEQVTDTVRGVTMTEQIMVPQLSDDEKKKIDGKIVAMQLEMDKLFKDSEKRALNNYHLNFATNGIIIGFGGLLLSLSLYFGFRSDEFTPFAGIAAAGGVANFIALFFSNPQTRLRRLIGDLVQMRMINASWVMEINIAYMQIKIDNYKLDTIIKVQKAISKITRAAVKDIENYIGSDSNSTGTSSTTEGTTRGDSGGNGGNGGGGKGPGGSGAAQDGNNPQQPQANQMQRSQQQQNSAATVSGRKIYNSDGKPVSR